MSDLPAPYAVPQYASKDPPRPSNGKIKLKVPPAHQSPPQNPSSTTATSPPLPQTTSLVLKVPGKESHAAQARTVSPSPIAGPSTTSISSAAKILNLANVAQATPETAPGRKSATSNPSDAAEVAVPAEITRAPALRSVALTITPTHRRLALDARDGVRSWSLRLAPSERGLRVSDVRLLRSEDSDDEDEGSEEEEEEEEAEEEEEGEDDEGEDEEGEGGKEEDEDEDPARTRKKGEVERVGRVKRPPPMRVRLDKTEVECRGRGRWEVALGPGPGARVLELSDTRGGNHGVWRVYLHCTA